MNWYGYAGCNPMVYVDRIGLAPSNDYLGPGVEGPQPKPQEKGFVPLVQNPSETPQKQTPNITGPSNSVEVVPLYENSDVYNNAVLSQGTKKKRSWFSINVEEPITKFIARNVFGLTPSDYVMLLDRTIVPMSESGTQFAYSERVVDCMSFCSSFLVGIGKLVSSQKILGQHSSKKVNDSFKKLYNYDPPYKTKTKVTVYELKETTNFVRVYDGENSRMKGSWLMKAEDIVGLTPQQIQDKYSLPNTPKYVCDVQLQKGTIVRTGEANPLYGFTGGGIQYDTYLNSDYVGIFSNERLLK